MPGWSRAPQNEYISAYARQNLKSLYIGHTWIRSHGLSNTLLSPGYVLQVAPAVGMVGGMYISRASGGEELWVALGPACGSSRGHVFSMTSSNMMPNKYLKKSYSSFR